MSKVISVMLILLTILTGFPKATTKAQQNPTPTAVPLPEISQGSEKSLIVTIFMDDGRVGSEFIQMVFGRTRGYLGDPDEFRIQLLDQNGETVGEIRTRDPRGMFIESFNQSSIANGIWSYSETGLLDWYSSLVELRDLTNDTTLYSLPHDLEVQGAQFSSSELQILSWTEGTVHVWNSSDGTLIVQKNISGLLGVDWQPNTNRFLVFSEEGDIQVWDASTNVQAFQINFGDDIQDAAWNSDGTLLLASSPSSIGIYDGMTGAILQELTSLNIDSAIWNPSGLTVMTWSEDETVEILDATSGAELFNLLHDAIVQGAAWSADGSRIVTWTGEAATIWRSSDGTKLYDVPIELVTGAVYGYDTDLIAFWSENTLSLFLLADGIPLLTSQFVHDTPIQSAIFSSGTNLLLYWADGMARIIDSINGGLIQSIMVATVITFDEEYTVRETVTSDLVVPFVPRLMSIRLTDATGYEYGVIDLSRTIEQFCLNQQDDAECQTWLASN